MTIRLKPLNYDNTSAVGAKIDAWRGRALQCRHRRNKMSVMRSTMQGRQVNEVSAVGARLAATNDTGHPSRKLDYPNKVKYRAVSRDRPPG
jgi:hypothetical protein